MLDLSNLPTSAVMRLSKVTPRREGAGLAWDVELAMEVPREQDAAVVEKYVPGSTAAFAAKESSKGEAKTSGGFDLSRISFKAEQGRPIHGHCEVKSASLKTSASQAMLILRARVHGLIPSSAMEVAYCLDEQVLIEINETGVYEATEITMPTKWDNLVGALVVHVDPIGGQVIAGIVQMAELDEDKASPTVYIKSMESEEIHIIDSASDIDTVLRVSTPEDGPELHVLISKYEEACRSCGLEPSWHDIIAAIGTLYGKNTISAQPDFSWELGAEVWTEALQIASDQQDY